MLGVQGTLARVWRRGPWGRQAPTEEGPRWGEQRRRLAPGRTGRVRPAPSPLRFRFRGARRAAGCARRWQPGGEVAGAGPGARAAPRAPDAWSLCRARRPLRLPGPRRGLARRPEPERAAPEDEGPIPFSASQASPRVWSVGRSMGSDHERPWAKVLPLSLLCAGLLLWCAFRERTEVDRRLEALLSGQPEDSQDVTRASDAAPRPREEE